MIIIRNKLKDLPKEQGDRLRFALVYQAGIANVFAVDCFNCAKDGRNARRVYQGDFRTAEAMSYGAGLAGAIVHTFQCNEAGDIAESKWDDNLDSGPFRESWAPVFFTIGI